MKVRVLKLEAWSLVALCRWGDRKAVFLLHFGRLLQALTGAYMAYATAEVGTQTRKWCFRGLLEILSWLRVPRNRYTSGFHSEVSSFGASRVDVYVSGFDVKSRPFPLARKCLLWHFILLTVLLRRWDSYPEESFLSDQSRWIFIRNVSEDISIPIRSVALRLPRSSQRQGIKIKPFDESNIVIPTGKNLSTPLSM